MAIHIKSGKNNVSTKPRESSIHNVPFYVHADCDAKVDKYFAKYIKDKGDYLTASFRGYPLRGKKVEVPEGYVGMVLHESIQPLRENDPRNFYDVNRFKSFTYWNWDKIPSNNDAISQALQWIEIAEVLHAPVID